MIPTIIIAERIDIIRNYYQENYELKRNLELFSPMIRIHEIYRVDQLLGFNYINQKILLLYGWKNIFCQRVWGSFFF